MFNNVVLDVFIGLVLLYLLYSLLMTIVSEMLATWLNLRSRILRVSIEKMLNDGYFPNKIRPSLFPWIFPWLLTWIVDFWVIIQRFFLREFKDFKSSFAGKFYEVPSIKYLTSRAGEPKTFFTQTKPSYISADNFADSLFRLLKESGSGNTDMDRIHFTLRFNAHHIQAGSLKQFRDMAENSGTNAALFIEKLKAWYNETQDRATGWYKKKLQLILFWLGFLVAAIFNVDSIRIAKILSKDKNAREQLVSMGVEMSKDSARYKNFIVSNGDTLHTQQIIDSGFSHINQDIRDANLVLGLGWGTDTLRKLYNFEIDTSNPDFIKLQKKISNDQYKRLTNAFRAQKEKYESDIDSIDRIQEQLNSYKVDSFIERTSVGRTRFALLSDSARLILQRLTAQKSKDSFSMYLLLRDINSIHRDANAAAGNSFKSINSIQVKPTDKNTIEILGERGYYWYEKGLYIFKRVRNLNGFWGFVITGLMISLGAPFWFDLLKKLVALRGDGVKPEEKEKKVPAPPVNNDNEKKAEPQQFSSGRSKTLIALDNLTQRSKDEQGIAAIGVEYKAESNDPFLQIIAENEEIKEFLQKKYGNKEKLDDDFSIPVEYSVDSKIIVHLAKSGSEIENETKALGAGTLGCHMKKKDSADLYFISCWHVMKDNSKWDEAPVNSTIICNNTPLGRIEKGFLSHHPSTGIDIAIAKYNNISDAGPNADFVITEQHRAVTAGDFVLKTPVKILGKVSGLVNARIFHNTINARVKYPDGKTYLMNDVFSMTVEDEKGNKMPPTRQGDSGAVVIDEKGIPLGMIIGGSGVFSYAIKFSNLFDDDKPLKEYFFNI